MSKGSLFHRDRSKKKSKQTAIYISVIAVSVLVLFSILQIISPLGGPLTGSASSEGGEDADQRSLSKSVYLVNLLFTVTILVLGIAGYKKNKDGALLTIGIAFGLFGVSHFLTLLGLGDPLEVLLISIKMSAYLLVTLAMYLSL